MNENVSIIACEATCQGCQGGLQWGERSIQLRHRLAANHLQEGDLTSHSVYFAMAAAHILLLAF